MAIFLRIKMGSHVESSCALIVHMIPTLHVLTCSTWTFFVFPFIPAKNHPFMGRWVFRPCFCNLNILRYKSWMSCACSVLPVSP
jgi:hypothetical protein